MEVFPYCKAGYISPTKHVSGREVEDRWEADRRQEECERRKAPPLSQPTGTKEHELDLSFQGPIPSQTTVLGITLFIPLLHSTLPSDLICWSLPLPLQFQIKCHQDRFLWRPRLHLFLARAQMGKWPRTKYNHFIIREKIETQRSWWNSSRSHSQ